MAAPVFSFIAYSGTGKTTYLEKLVACLKSRGLNVGVIKHDAHEFDIDKTGKDTWRYTQAGADAVAIASNERFAFMESRRVELDEIISLMSSADIILVEGWHSEGLKKIGVFRESSGSPLKGRPEDFVAIVSDAPMEAGVPLFPLDSPEPLADFLTLYI